MMKCGPPRGCDQGARPNLLRIGSYVYLKNEIQTRMLWRVEILNEIVAAEIAALPEDMQARFLRLSDRIGQVRKAWASRT